MNRFRFRFRFLQVVSGITTWMFPFPYDDLYILTIRIRFGKK